MSPPATIILKQPLPTDAVSLGRLVQNPQDPSQDYYEPPTPPTDVSTQRLEKFNELLTKTRDTRLHAFLTTIISSSTSFSNEQTTQIDSALCITRQLHNSSDYFRDLCLVPRARRWLEYAITRKFKVYLVVGLKTVTDATVTLREGRSREVAAEAQVPVGAAAASVGVMLPGVVDPGFGVSNARGTASEVGFFAPGEQVYAVQYRRVEFARFSGRKIETSWLESGNRWELYIGSRGAREEGEDREVNGMEVTLGEDTGEEILGGHGEVVALGDEKVYFFP
ncbi:hypothetical protein P170DRAFT_438047 [Aspergillus steynii IBT 23096]|uniref:Uncharacterized protein n=1 Tax=Aspergillus steynii IBT 23096 TaxID=1392250 RepID=A0A2I2G694_9EURO|nr:uncharacterized protein P170DRAFT_438047 [Aspergillus steynii IBT 23096]PLB48392.1 hypothetical protein P170DRAFT_438047 [Aspergillus steynii IBT 23096]